MFTTQNKSSKELKSLNPYRVARHVLSRSSGELGRHMQLIGQVEELKSKGENEIDSKLKYQNWFNKHSGMHNKTENKPTLSPNKGKKDNNISNMKDYDESIQRQNESTNKNSETDNKKPSYDEWFSNHSENNNNNQNSEENNNKSDDDDYDSGKSIDDINKEYEKLEQIFQKKLGDVDPNRIGDSISKIIDKISGDLSNINKKDLIIAMSAIGVISFCLMTPHVGASYALFSSILCI